MPADVPTYGAAPDPDEAPLGIDDELDDLPEVGQTDDVSDADTIRRELDEEVLKTVTLPIPGRPRYSVTYRLDFTDKDLDTWSRRAGDKAYKAKLSGTKFALVGLASTCTAVLRDGEPVVLDGKPATFRSVAFLREVLGVQTAAQGVRKLYGGVEGYIDSAMRKVMVAAGWGDETDEVTEDGTDPS